MKSQSIPHCITDHLGFQSVSLCEWNLQAVYFMYRRYHGPMTGIDQHHSYHLLQNTTAFEIMSLYNDWRGHEVFKSGRELVVKTKKLDLVK